MANRKSGDEFDRKRPDDPNLEMWDMLGRMQRESKDAIGRFQKELDAIFRKHRMALEAKMASDLGRLDRRVDSATKGKPGRKRPPRGKGGSEPVTVEPNRPKKGEGGAAAALEFDE